jgi:hypothetical protein
MTSTDQKPPSRARTVRYLRPLVAPDHLPGEDEYGAFVTHMVGCADCGYGQVQCEKATELWQAYKAKKRTKKRA